MVTLCAECLAEGVQVISTLESPFDRQPSGSVGQKAPRGESESVALAV